MVVVVGLWPPTVVAGGEAALVGGEGCVVVLDEGGTVVGVGVYDVDEVEVVVGGATTLNGH
jgi:hypothetical protein